MKVLCSDSIRLSKREAVSVSCDYLIPEFIQDLDEVILDLNANLKLQVKGS